MAKLKGLEKVRFLERKRKENWLKTASPYLIAKYEQKQSPPKSIQKTYFITKQEKPKYKKPPKVDYKKYILSKEWWKRRFLFYKKFGKKCAACRSEKNLNVHHATYQNLGREKDEDLFALCKNCHKEYHDLFGVQSNMLRKTHKFIKNKRKNLSPTRELYTYPE